MEHLGFDRIHMCHGQGCRYIGDGHTTFNRNPYNGYINPYYWVDDHPLLYGAPGICLATIDAAVSQLFGQAVDNMTNSSNDSGMKDGVCTYKGKGRLHLVINRCISHINGLTNG